MNTNHNEAVQKFINEFGPDLMALHAFDEDQVFGISGQGLAADLLTGDVNLYVTLKDDPDRRPLQIVEMPFFNPEWAKEDALTALEEHLGLAQDEATLRLRRAGLLTGRE